jgi:hypothetical protein
MPIERQSPVKQNFNQTPEKRFTQAGRFNDDLFDLLNQFNIKSFKDALQSFKTSLNNYFFLSGDHKAITLKQRDTLFSVAGANITTRTTFSTSQNIVSGVYFTEEVIISGTGNVLFDKCRFAKLVTVEANGKAQFSSCIFEASVNNIASIANVNIIGCLKSSLNTYSNCTIIATQDY